MRAASIRRARAMRSRAHSAKKAGRRGPPPSPAIRCSSASTNCARPANRSRTWIRAPTSRRCATGCSSPAPISARSRSRRPCRAAPTSCSPAEWRMPRSRSARPRTSSAGAGGAGNRLAAGLTLGHLLECSGQGSGGNFGSAGEWAKIPDYAHLGYPIAEVSEDGSALFTKPPGTRGPVSFDTIRQQLLYEVHNPHAYFSPDVVLDMGTLEVDDQGGDRVRIAGASGAARPATLKIVAGYQDGWMGTGVIGFAWPEAYAKCEKSADIIHALVKERGWAVEETNV